MADESKPSLPSVPSLDRRCGSCARFVRVIESTDQNGEVRRHGECLLGVWSPPLYETNTCSQYVAKGTFRAHAAAQITKSSRERRREPRTSSDGGATSFKPNLSLPKDLLDMDAEEFRAVLREVLVEELGSANNTTVDLGGRWSGGEMVLKPGKEGTQEKRIPIESFFHKIVMLRDKLRVLEAKVNAHPTLSDEDKVQMQQYVTACYGTLTTFNVLFAAKEDGFTGQGT